MEALECIRTQMQPLGVYQDDLHDLTGCLVCESSEELKETFSWEGPTERGRLNTLKAVQVCAQLQQHHACKTLLCALCRERA
jgi:hypothetical protein